MDQKNADLANLKRYISEADEQYEKALQAHLINIDTLIDIQESRLSSLKDQFESDLSTLDTEFNTER